MRAQEAVLSDSRWEVDTLNCGKACIAPGSHSFTCMLASFYKINILSFLSLSRTQGSGLCWIRAWASSSHQSYTTSSKYLSKSLPFPCEKKKKTSAYVCFHSIFFLFQKAAFYLYQQNRILKSCHEDLETVLLHRVRC